MSEPPQKRLKITEDKKVDYMFGDDADRFLLIEGKIFHVQSNKLLRHSEYFRALFTSGFSEKDQKEIELKGIDADDARVFFTALFERDTFDVQNVDLECLIKVSNYFQANEYLVGLFEENPRLWVENLSSEKILTLTVDYGILELKDAVEKSLIVDFNQRLKLKNPIVHDSEDMDESIVPDSNDIDESITTCLRLITDYELMTMKAVVDDHLAEYYRENRDSHYYEGPWISLIQEHQLNKLKEAMEEVAIAQFQKRYTYHKYRKSILGKYGDAINSLPLDKLKANAEQLFVVEMKKGPCDMFECLDLFRIGTRYNMDSLKTSVEDYMLLECLEEEGTFKRNWNGRVGRSYHESKERMISNINLILASLLNNGLDRIKDKMEDFLIAEFTKIKASKKKNRDELIIDMVSFAKHLPRYKTIIDSYCTKLFNREKNKMGYEKYRYALKQYDETLVAVIKAHLLSEYEKPKADRQLKFEDSSFVSLAFEFKFTDFMDRIQNNYVAEFESDESSLESMEDLVEKYEMPILKDAIEEYLIEDFEATRDFKHADIALMRGYPKFKDVLTAFLSTAHVEDPVMQANRNHILKMSESDQLYIFRCLFRET